ncbi:MAG TPA: NAD-glutamate dehydrogenase domain-containing protein [Gaiellaceae bacterium]|nr:NAD-glutamate dehydrogenase domain-containing protein [Gaiellaceae bacterium]
MSLAEETEAGTSPAARLLELIDETLPGDGAQPLRAFAQAYLRRLSGDATGGISAEDLLAEVRGAFEFASARREEPVAVRAFNPTREEHGYEPRGSVVETNTDDWPFLVDSVTGELEHRGLEISRLLHPVVGVERDEQGRIAAIGRAREAPHRESIMHFDLGRRLDDDELADVERCVRSALLAVRGVVADFPAMTERVDDMVTVARAGTTRYPRDEVHEVADFLEWLLQGNFVLLGAREYDFADGAIRVVPGSGLGILRDEEKSAFAKPVPLRELPPSVLERAMSGDLLLVDKTNAISPVHRHERMDYVGVRSVSRAGESVGESRLLGLFTSKAYAERASETPMLHRKLRQVLDAEDLIEGSHDYKAAVTLFDSFPKEELFAAPMEDLREAVVALTGLEGSDRVRVLGRRAADGRSASAIVALPRSRYSPALVARLTALLRTRFQTSSVEAHHVLDEGQRVRVHFSTASAEGLADVSFDQLERDVLALARTWDDDLGAALAAAGTPAAPWAQRFPEHYKGYTTPEVGAIDVANLARLSDGESFVVGLHGLGPATRVAVYKQGAKIELSRVMPMLEDLGLRVIEEIATRLLGDEETWVQEFRVRGPGDLPLDLDAVGDRVADAITAVYRGEDESDPLNRLVITAGLDRGQVAILRAYRKYRQRLGSRFTEGYQNDVLAANSPITAKLVRYFELRFDPSIEPDEEAERALRDEILADLEDVTSIDHDRILRNQLGAIDATLRTNAYKEGRGATSFKLRSADVPAIPLPAPAFEIYVYAPDMEGIHLRGGPIARGGIRFSDRMDYRTEVYGLMRAQLTKNAIIVPAGAKGGFIVKRPDIDKGVIEESYKTYIRSLLDVTDNLVDGAVVHPEAVRVRDEDDTYLVVAADKGTATFSDTANAVAAEYGFWLDDAFASGGSVGYDHKKLGITARGAWESVKRHFRELGIDPAVNEFTAVGIGDMSGDVFGNGMLLSDRMRLLAAYDHRHLFIDPDPDPAASFAERRRLFEMPGSSWDDYDRDVLSEGGDVYRRDAKWIELSPRARELLGLDEDRVAPTDVIRAILRAPVDLLWNGGIGTVVKASTESDADAADRASDSIRVDARDLRARVVGEGGNLGLTRRARVEYSAAGGLINADFIDNSAGVDCSDHEVNLKILLGLAERRGEMTRPERDQLLEAVTEDVVQHVLYDSFLQAQIIAQEVERSGGRMFAYEDLTSLLEETGLLDRAKESLPSNDEIAERRRGGGGLERPELAVLLAYSKRWVARSLESAGFADDPWFERDLRAYFPDPVVERCGHLLLEHPLRTQLICMINANAVVNALGPTFVSQLVAERDADVAAVVRAFRVAVEVTGAAPLWEAVEQLDGVDRASVIELLGGVDSLVEAVARWYLVWAPGADLDESIAAGREGFERLEAVLADLGTEERRQAREELAARLEGEGVPAVVARSHALRSELAHAPDVTAVAAATDRSIEDAARLFFALGTELRLDWMERELARARSATRMQRWAAQALREDASEARRALAIRAFTDAPGAEPVVAVEQFLHDNAGAARRLDTLMRALSREGDPDLAGVTLAVRQLRALVG